MKKTNPRNYTKSVQKIEGRARKEGFLSTAIFTALPITFYTERKVANFGRLSAPDVIEGFEEYRNPESAAIEATTDEVRVEPAVIEQEEVKADLTALADRCRTSSQPITFSQVLSHFDGDRVPACQFLKDFVSKSVFLKGIL